MLKLSDLGVCGASELDGDERLSVCRLLFPWLLVKWSSGDETAEDDDEVDDVLVVVTESLWCSNELSSSLSK